MQSGNRTWGLMSMGKLSLNIESESHRCIWQPDINHSSGKDSKPTHKPCLWARLNTLRHTQTETLRGCMCVRRSSFEQKGHLLSLDDLWGSWGGTHSDESWLCPSSFLCPSCSTCMCCHQQSSFPSLYCMNAHTHSLAYVVYGDSP